MLDRTHGPARNLLRGRERLDREEIERLREAGTLIIDGINRRPLYFDGRFLAARDLTREQNYFLSRQAELGRALGTGVVSGLNVTQGANAFSISISPGQGVSQSGELLVAPSSITVELADIPKIQRLNQVSGLSQFPKTPERGRSGLFILALRAIEYTASIAVLCTSTDAF